MVRAKIIQILLLSLGFIILISFLLTIDFKNLPSIITNLGLPAILTLIIVILLNILVKALRWNIFIKKISGINLTVKFSVASIISGVAASSLFPGRIEMAKPLMLKNEKNVPLAKSFSALFMERIFDFLALILVLVVSLMLIPKQSFINNELIIIFSIILITIILTTISFPKRIASLAKYLIKIIPLLKVKQKANQICDQFFTCFEILQKKKLFLLILIISLSAHFLEIARFYILLQFLQLNVSLAIVGFIFSVVVILSILTMIPGGIGITEFSTTAILAVFVAGSLEGISELIKNAVLIDRALSYYALVLIGALILIGYNLKNHSCHTGKP